MIDLEYPNPGAIRAFVTAITERAISDHAAKKAGVSGGKLCEEYCSNWRIGHRRLASSIYRKIRWSLDLGEGRDSKF